MRILGWLLLVGGLLLCVSIFWAAPGFFCMGLRLIFLQVAEQKRRRAKSAASPSDQSEPQVEQAPIPEATRALVPPEADEDGEAGRENVTALYAYDRRKWRALLASDADISRLVKVLEPYGQKYVDEFAAAYLAVNHKDYLPMILRKIIASARRDSGQNTAGDFPDENTNPDAVAIASNRSRRIDRVRETGSGYAEKSASVDDVPRIEAGPEKEPAAQSSGPQFSGDVDVSAARKALAEETNRKAPVADAASNLSTARRIAVGATSPEPPEVADAAVGPEEKKSEVDAVGTDNLTEILDRLSQASTPKTK
jgi:hypothetical protein